MSTRTTPFLWRCCESEDLDRDGLPDCCAAEVNVELGPRMPAWVRHPHRTPRAPELGPALRDPLPVVPLELADGPDAQALLELRAADVLADSYRTRGEAQQLMFELWDRPGLTLETWVLVTHRLASSLHQFEREQAFEVRAALWERLAGGGDPRVVFDGLSSRAQAAVLTELVRLGSFPERWREPELTLAASEFATAHADRLMGNAGEMAQRNARELRDGPGQGS